MLTRRHFFASTIAAAAHAQTNARPNVLVILTDDQGYGDIAAHGNPVLKTPNMDKLHGESVRFIDFHSAPMCTPTRGQLMSGVDALRNKACSVTAGRAVLRRDLPTMADVFAANGYKTGIFGKWHLGDSYPYRPMDRGFQTAKYHLGFGMSSAPEFDNDYVNGRYHDNGEVKRFEGYCTDFWFSEAMSWMKQRGASKEPFFCYLPTNAPHGPAWVSPKYSDRYNRDGLPAGFFGMIANVDENLGKLDQFLAQSGLRENTIVVFMTDNGGTAGVNVFNAGMRARKTQLYDGGHRVPCFVRWPKGNLRPAGDVEYPAQMQDLLPTMIDLCSLKPPTRSRFDGATLAPLLRGKAEMPGRMMVVQYGQVPKKWESNVIWNQWRLVNGTELYDFRANVAEDRDLAAANPDVVARMRAHYEKWWAAVEPGVREPEPVAAIGSKQEPMTLLCSSDWWEIYADNPGHVSNAAGGAKGAPWYVAVAETGEYQIEISRWAFNLGLPLTATREAQKLTYGSLPVGKGMPIAGAKLKAGAGAEVSAKSAPGDRSVTFRVKLDKAARIPLHAWFTGANGEDVCGAFYARIKKV
ncbi:MAG TPA: arylsulfatase [Bryobacteraceae bacterium]|nr:arylsulfatase [Bryobacteraceae bacterium]